MRTIAGMAVTAICACLFVLPNSSATAATGACPAPRQVLQGVYHPSRLTVLKPCQHAAGRVVSVRQEEDGDLHIDVRLDSRWRRLLAPGNAAQGGALVVEFMPRDAGHLPRPQAGDRLAMVGAWVLDTAHGWNELHPVWSVRLNGAPGRVSGPQFGGSPGTARSGTAVATCRTQTSAACRGYGAPAPAPVRTRPPARARCNPNYVPCVPNSPTDLDCRDIGFPVTVVGTDVYRLDGDGDGRGCESYG